MGNKNKPDGNRVPTITKLMLSNLLAENELMTKPKAKVVIQAVVDCMIALLTDGQSVILKGCGVLSTHEKSERPGRNPKTGEPHLITARKVITFGKIPNNKNRAATPKICSIISSLADVNADTARIALDVVIDCIKGVKGGDFRIEFRGLGVFYYTEQHDSLKRNPNTGEPVLLAGTHTYLKFKASRLLLNSINHK